MTQQQQPVQFSVNEKRQKKNLKILETSENDTQLISKRRNNSAVYTLDFLSHREEAKLLLFFAISEKISFLSWLSSYMFHDDCSYM